MTADAAPIEWAAPEECPELRGDAVHLWCVELADQVQQPHAALSPREIEYAAGFHSDRDRSRYVLSHSALRCVLASYLNRDGAELVYSYGPCGKPELVDGEIRFSVSHCGDLALIAISATRDIGVDVASVRLPINRQTLRWMLPAHVMPRSEADLLQAWTRMEAYYKARGDGLPNELDGFEQFLEPAAIAADEPWWFHDFSRRADFIATFATPGESGPIEYWKWVGPDLVKRVERS